MRAIVVVVGLVAAAAAASADQDPLNVARDLYASAAYEEALSTLSRLTDARGSVPGVARQADQYRAFCLYALGRVSEAESVAESLLRREPLLQLDAADASPRIEAMFVGVQKRILPGVIRERYRESRAFIDQKQYGEAEPHLAEVRRLLSEAQRLGAWDEGLADLTELVDGFLTLTRSQAAPAPQSATAAASAPPPSAPAPSAPAASEPPPATAAAQVPRASAGEPRVDRIAEPRIFHIDDADVRPPVVIFQNAPSAPIELLTVVRALHKQMVLTVLIDETGSVQKAEVRGSIHPSYDSLLLRAARNWKYRPAVKDGVPVKYEKTVIIDVR
jgi:TonB family protein